MSELYNVKQESNPIYKQAERTNAALDLREKESAEEITRQYHAELDLSQTVKLQGSGVSDLQGMNREAQLLKIYAKQAIRG